MLICADVIRPSLDWLLRFAPARHNLAVEMARTRDPSGAFTALTASPGARAYYDELRARDIGHDDALRRVGSRLTGILHGCIKTGRDYDEVTAWSHRAGLSQAA